MSLQQCIPSKMQPVQNDLALTIQLLLEAHLVKTLANKRVLILLNLEEDFVNYPY